MPIKLLYLGLGGALGTIGRFLLSSGLQQTFGFEFPFGTLGVNLLGCFIIGVLAQLFEAYSLPSDLRLFLMTGVLGGFTTFSAFGLDSLGLMQQGELQRALLYVGCSVGLGLVAVWAGMAMIKWIVPA